MKANMDIDSNAADAVNNPEQEGPGTAVIVRPEFAMGSPQESLKDQVSAPVLQLVHAVGTLAKGGTFNPGDMVLDKTHLVVPKGKSIRMIVLGFTRFFKEYCSPERWNSGDRNMRVFATAAEAHAAGFTTETNPLTQQRATAPMAMQWAMLLEKPADLICEQFFVHANGQSYAPARMYLERSAWWAVSKPFSMAASFSHKPVSEGGRGIHSAVWTLKAGTYTAKASGNSSWVPNIALAGSLTDDEIKAIAAAM